METHFKFIPQPYMPPGAEDDLLSPLNDNGDRRGAEMIAGLCVLAAVVIALCAWMGWLP